MDNTAAPTLISFTAARQAVTSGIFSSSSSAFFYLGQLATAAFLLSSQLKGSWLVPQYYNKTKKHESGYTDAGSQLMYVAWQSISAYSCYSLFLFFCVVTQQFLWWAATNKMHILSWFLDRDFADRRVCTHSWPVCLPCWPTGWAEQNSGPAANWGSPRGSCWCRRRQTAARGPVLRDRGVRMVRGREMKLQWMQSCFTTLTCPAQTQLLGYDVDLNLSPLHCVHCGWMGNNGVTTTPRAAWAHPPTTAPSFKSYWEFNR